MNDEGVDVIYYNKNCSHGNGQWQFISIMMISVLLCNSNLACYQDSNTHLVYLVKKVLNIENAKTNLQNKNSQGLESLGSTKFLYITLIAQLTEPLLCAE